MPPAAMQALMAAKAGAPAPGATPGAPTTPQPPGTSPTGMAPQGGAPMAAPMATPTPPAGRQETARAHVNIAMTMLEQALPAFGTQTPEGAAILKVLSSLAKDFGQKDSSDLVPAQIMEMVRGMPQMGGGSPVQQQLIKQMQAGQQGGQPPQAGAAPGMPH